MGRRRRSLNDAIFNVENQLDNIIKQTAKEVARKLKKDMKKQAKKVVKHYYDKYYPEMYERTFALYHSYEVFNETKGNVVSVSVVYNPDLIRGEHKSHSRYHQTGNKWQSIDWPNEKPSGNNYGIPDSEWIINNFWEGIHPIVTGSKYEGFEWAPRINRKSPEDLFNEFANGPYLSEELIPYANEILSNKILKALSKQFK